MNKYSPGPWLSGASLSSDTRHIRHISDANGVAVADIRYPLGMSQEEALANAALIKSAPDLLASLEECIASLQPGRDDVQIRRAQAIIAKAKNLKPQRY